MIRRHLVLFVGGALIIFALVVIVTFVTPRKYRGEAQIQIKLGRENVGLDGATALADQAPVNMVQSLDQEINTVANVLGSRNIAELVVEALTPEFILSNEEPGFIDNLMAEQPDLAKGLSPYHTLSKQDQAIWKVQDKIKIRPIKESNTIKVHYDSNDPEKSTRIVNAFVDAYKREHRRIHNVQGSAKFLRQVVAENLEGLVGKQEELRKLRADSMLIAVAEQRAATVDRRSKVKSDLIAARANLKSSEAELKTLNSLMKQLDSTMMMSKTAGGSKAASEMRALLFELEIKEKDLLSRFNENHVNVKAIQQQIAAVKKVLHEEENKRTDVVEGPSRAFLDTNSKVIEKQAIVAGLQERINELKAALADLDGDLLELNQNEIRIDQLESKISVLKSNYQKYQVEAEQARVDEALNELEFSNLRMVRATMNPFPVYPLVPLNLAVGFVLAIFGGAVLAYLGEFRMVRKRSGVPQSPPRPTQGHAASNGEVVSNGEAVANREAPVTVAENSDENQETDERVRTARIPR